MAKKALVSTIEPRGKDNAGYRVLEVVDAANTFETHTNLQWKDCADTVEMDKYWWDPATSAFKKLPEAVDTSTAGELATTTNEAGETVPTEAYEWNWDTESWSKVQVL
jgi:hypothetical protein